MIKNKKVKKEDGYDLAMVEYETCFLAFVDHLNATGFILESLGDVMKLWKMEKPLVALFHDRINVLTSQKNTNPETGDLELVASLKLGEIFQPNAAIGCRLLQTRVNDFSVPEKKLYSIQTCALGEKVIDESDRIILDPAELVAIELQKGYTVFFGVS